MENRQPNTLFRQEAVAHAANNLLGKVLVIPKPSAVFVSLFLFIWLALGIYWLCTAQYARQVTVRGWLEPDAGATNHFSTLSHGIVTDILVRPGDTVVIGQPLVKMVAEQQSAAGQAVNGMLKSELLTQLELLQRETARLRDDQYRQQQFIASQIQQTQQEQKTVADIQAALAKQQAMAKAHMGKIEQLVNKGWASEWDLNQAHDKVLQLNTETTRIAREQIVLTKQYQSLEQELVALPSKFEEQLNALKQRMADAKQALIRLDASTEEVVFAKVAGRVSDVFVQSGKINNSEPLLTIIPNDISFVALIPVPTHAAGFVQQGQSLALRYDAYPHEKYGLYYGEIATVSDSVLLPKDLPQAAVPLNEPVYMVKARVESDSIQAYGRDVELKSGVTFSADIGLGERSVLEWLFAPLMSLHGRL